ncbi:MAG: MerR family transcriptional regulator [Chlorobi bacterium]|nr:MerR family transcriptional regulator [Chlorobiota bacterium]
MDTGDSDKKYYRIHEVARMLGLEQSTLRYWEKEFPSLKPRRHGNERLYTRRDIELLEYLKYLLKEEKYTIEGARRRLRKRRHAPRDREELIRLLGELRDELIELKRHIRRSDKGEETEK